MTSFRHSGKIGDVIYSLPAVRALGGGAYYIRAGCLPEFNESAASSLIPLLEAQPYISTACLHRGEAFEVDLDAFRARAHQVADNLADSHLYVFGLAKSERDKAWLCAPARQIMPVVFARSRLRRGVLGFWQEAYRILGKQAVFVGLRDDHEEFERLCGHTHYVETRNMLDLASIVQGARLFVGDQSAPRAIAEGLKKPVILEVCPQSPNCSFGRPFELDVVWGADLERMHNFSASCV